MFKLTTTKHFLLHQYIHQILKVHITKQLSKIHFVFRIKHGLTATPYFDLKYKAPCQIQDQLRLLPANALFTNLCKITHPQHLFSIGFSVEHLEINYDHYATFNFRPKIMTRPCSAKRPGSAKQARATSQGDVVSYEDLLVAQYLDELRKSPPYTKATYVLL